MASADPRAGGPGGRRRAGRNLDRHLAAGVQRPRQGRPAGRGRVLSRSDLFADALAGGALAAHKNGPLLLTGTAAWTRR
ncbi:cell wall-binding repeat-containing protein [Catenulispora yoronensis]